MIEHRDDWWGQLEWRTTVNENWKIILWWFQLVTWGGQEKTFDSRICAWTNRLTDELINNTLADLMRHWFPLRSMPLMPTLMWRHRCSHPQSKHIGRSLAGAPRSPLSRRDEAEIFSIKSTWSQCHRFPLQFSSWLAERACTRTSAPVCILMPVCAQHPSITSSDGISADAASHSCLNWWSLLFTC